MAAAVVTVAHARKQNRIRGHVITWTSSDTGDATGTVTLDGAIVRVVTNPGATAPTDNWDLTIIDADGIDILATEGLNRDTATSEQIFPTNTPFHNGDVTVTIANAGDTKDGVVTLYMAWG